MPGTYNNQNRNFNRHNPTNNKNQPPNNKNQAAERVAMCSKAVKDCLSDYKGNFSLWYNKFISWKDKNNGFGLEWVEQKKDISTQKFIDQYGNCKEKIIDFLSTKHSEQKIFLLANYNFFHILEVTATTKTPLITGIGQSHPTEVGITLDFNLGIPYIPASTVKGLLRYNTTLNYLINYPTNGIKIDDTDIKEVAYYFGGQENSGSMIILDAYPKDVPELVADVMTPHYSNYYQKGEPPADYNNPVPIKFLAVNKGTKFVFRFLIPKKDESNKDLENIKTVVTKMLTEEGVGAKTALGYGLFNKEIEFNDYSNEIKELQEKKRQEKENAQLDNMTEAERYCFQLEKYTENQQDVNNAVVIYNKLNNFNNEDKIKIAQALKSYFIRINKWEKVNEKQAKKVCTLKEILGET